MAVGGVLKSLHERGLIDVVGRAEGLGRPLLYGTTPVSSSTLRCVISRSCRAPTNWRSRCACSRESPSRSPRPKRANDVGDDAHPTRAGARRRRVAPQGRGAGRRRSRARERRSGGDRPAGRSVARHDRRRRQAARGAARDAVDGAEQARRRHDHEVRSRGRRTVFDLVPNIPGLTYVGRLDYLTEGVLLLTTDGDAAHRLSHPSNEVERTYVATVIGKATRPCRSARRRELDDGPVHPNESRRASSAAIAGSSKSRSPRDGSAKCAGSAQRSASVSSASCVRSSVRWHSAICRLARRAS